MERRQIFHDEESRAGSSDLDQSIEVGVCDSDVLESCEIESLRLELNASGAPDDDHSGCIVDSQSLQRSDDALESSPYRAQRLRVAEFLSGEHPSRTGSALFYAAGETCQSDDHPLVPALFGCREEICDVSRLGMLKRVGRRASARQSRSSAGCCSWTCNFRQTIAIENFKQKAAELAKGFGFTGYTLREVAVNANEPGFGPTPRMAMQAKAMSSDASVPVEAGKSTVTVTVSGSVQLR